MEETRDEVIELINENGETETFEHVMTLEYQEHAYLIMHPVGADDVDDGEVVVLSVDADDDGREVYNLVEDPELAQNVFDEFLLILEADEENE